MIVFAHTKFDLVRTKGSEVKRGAEFAPPPRPERVFEIPAWIGLRAMMSVAFSFRYNSSSLRFDLIPWQFQNTMFRPMKLIKGYLSWMTMHLVGGFRLLGDSLGGVARWSGF